MTLPEGLSRRTLLVKLGIAFNAAIAAVLAVPIVRYLMSPVIHERKGGYDAWVSLGNLEQFPPGQTRFATYRNPVVNPWDGTTGDIACWVRNVDGKTFQVFAINCAHLGCPVRWFPQSSLFLCPCHGGAYYQDGSRASGPPER
jgi:Rieske Fe-S protein